MRKDMGGNDDKDSRERWYYDACALHGSASAYGEIFRSKNPVNPVVSHLALGEALANCRVQKSGKKRQQNLDEKTDAFIELIKKLDSYITIVENDGCDSYFNKIQEKFPRLGITDALHMAIALREHCVVFYTSDSDLLGLPSQKVRDLGKVCGVERFAVVKRDFREG